MNDAIRDKDYYCPCCDEKLTLRAGNIKRKHFSHRNDSKCDPESVYHKLAKFLICYAISENAKGNLNNGNKVAIEVFHTHEIYEEKKKNLSIPWIELKSETVIEDPFL
ncbi:competence protein CoiA family protein [Pluralibacter gergoviae]|uniref:competence protein CoiA family protein n=1 Tax=Pluralibacter gergoviae TaxID=61647 RepID=UPI001E4EB1DC|nr:competence protein CoiA family protein [Pluralibacter gergoviae]